MDIRWTISSFEALSVDDLYKIIQLRVEVFCIEQQCIYQDLDGKDQPSLHLCGWVGDQLAAYCRLLPAGISYPHPSIGRVLTSPAFRRLGLGKLMMQQAIQKTIARFQDPIIIISAQLYLLAFYSDLGFVQTSDPYLEDDIPHIQMQYGT